MTPRHGSYLRSGARKVCELRELREIEQSAHRIDLVVADRQPLDELLAHRVRHRVGDLEPDDTAERTPPQLRPQLLEQIVGLVGQLEVRIPRHPKDTMLLDLHTREEPVEVMRDHILEWQEGAGPVDLEEPWQRLGNLQARETLFSRRRMANDEAEAQRERRDVRERLPRPDAERCQHREDLAAESPLEGGAVLLRQIVDRADDDAGLRERRPKIVCPELRLHAADREHALADLGERLTRQPPVGRANQKPRLHLVEQARRRES